MIVLYRNKDWHLLFVKKETKLQKLIQCTFLETFICYPQSLICFRNRRQSTRIFYFTNVSLNVGNLSLSEVYYSFFSKWFLKIAESFPELWKNGWFHAIFVSIILFSALFHCLRYCNVYKVCYTEEIVFILFTVSAETLEISLKKFKHKCDSESMLMLVSPSIWVWIEKNAF